MKSLFLLFESIISLLWGIGIIKSMATHDCQCEPFWILFSILLIFIGILSLIYNFIPNPFKYIISKKNFIQDQ